MRSGSSPSSHVSPDDVGLSKTLIAVQLLARDLLTRVPGERIPTALQYQQLIGVGSGTVQKALRTLQSIGAVKLHPRGHTGTFLVDVAIAQLWSFASIGAPTAVLPLATSPELMGLATALREEFKRLQIPLQVLYTYGSGRRLELIERGEADFTVLSGAAAQDLCDNDPTWQTLSLAPTSFYYENSWFILTRRGLDPLATNSIRRIGIDPSSHDHAMITEAEFPLESGYEYVEGNFPFMTEKLAVGEIDAMAWHQSSLAIPLAAVGIRTRPLQQPAALEAVARMHTAMIVVHSSRKELVRALQLLDLGALASLQGKVISQEVLPLY
ncbi:YhfZ family protein [Pseudonocardia kunmingensis]|nr:YhfZ family protein [Pseudonocardia kunmingensis]